MHGDVLRLNMDDLITDLAQRQQERRNSNAQASTSSSSDGGSSSSSSSGVDGPARRSAKVKVVANLPYNITKDFLKALLPRGQHISQLSIMIQVGRLLNSCEHTRISTDLYVENPHAKG